MPHIPKISDENLTKLVLSCMFCMLLVVVYVWYSSYQGRVDLVYSQRAGCERGKLDRIDNAAFQRAHKIYIDRVVLAQSVKADVKRAAREAVITYNRTAANLYRRSKINCQTASPKASLIP